MTHPSDTPGNELIRGMMRAVAHYLRRTGQSESMAAELDRLASALMPAPARGWSIDVVDVGGRQVESVRRSRKPMDAGL